jgi:hypothetical protein
MRKVLIVNDSGHDFSLAEKYGQLTIMSKGLIDRYNITGMKRAFDQHIEASGPEDFILHTGPGVMSAVACSMFASKHGRLNILLWRAEEDGNDRYVHRKVVFK